MPSTPGGGPPRQQSLDTILRDLQKRMTALESVTGGQTVGTPSSNLGGDLGGTLAAANVVGIQSRPVGAQAPSSEQGLVWNGSDWIPESIVNSFEGRTGDVTLADVGALPSDFVSSTYVRVDLSTAQTIPAGGAGGTYNKLNYDSVWSGSGPWDTGNHLYTVPATGIYYYHQKLCNFSDNNMYVGPGLYRNGSYYDWMWPPGGAVGTTEAPMDLIGSGDFDAGDIIEAYMWQNNPNSFTVSVGGDSNCFEIWRIA